MDNNIPAKGKVHNNPRPPPFIPWLLSAANSVRLGINVKRRPKKVPLVGNDVNNFIGVVPLCLGFNMSIVQRLRSLTKPCIMSEMRIFLS